MFEKKKQFDLNHPRQVGITRKIGGLWFIFNYIYMAYANENEYFRKIGIGIGEKSRPTLRNRKSAKMPIGSSLVASRPILFLL